MVQKSDVEASTLIELLSLHLGIDGPSHQSKSGVPFTEQLLVPIEPIQSNSNNKDQHLVGLCCGVTHVSGPAIVGEIKPNDTTTDHLLLGTDLGLKIGKRKVDPDIPHPPLKRACEEKPDSSPSNVCRVLPGNFCNAKGKKHTSLKYLARASSGLAKTSSSNLIEETIMEISQNPGTFDSGISVSVQMAKEAGLIMPLPPS